MKTQNTYTDKEVDQKMVTFPFYLFTQNLLVSPRRLTNKVKSFSKWRAQPWHLGCLDSVFKWRAMGKSYCVYASRFDGKIHVVRTDWNARVTLLQKQRTLTQPKNLPSRMLPSPGVNWIDNSWEMRRPRIRREMRWEEKCCIRRCTVVLLTLNWSALLERTHLIACAWFI